MITVILFLQILRQNSFTSSNTSQKSLHPQLTSTPVSEHENAHDVSSDAHDTHDKSDMKPKKVKSSTMTLSPNVEDEWSSFKQAKPSKPPPPKPPVRFRTTALRNQYQRWSFAEMPGPGPGYPNGHNIDHPHPTCAGYNPTGMIHSCNEDLRRFWRSALYGVY